MVRGPGVGCGPAGVGTPLSIRAAGPRGACKPRRQQTGRIGSEGAQAGRPAPTHRRPGAAGLRLSGWRHAAARLGAPARRAPRAAAGRLACLCGAPTHACCCPAGSLGLPTPRPIPCSRWSATATSAMRQVERAGAGGGGGKPAPLALHPSDAGSSQPIGTGRRCQVPCRPRPAAMPPPSHLTGAPMPPAAAAGYPVHD